MYKCWKYKKLNKTLSPELEEYKKALDKVERMYLDLMKTFNIHRNMDYLLHMRKYMLDAGSIPSEIKKEEYFFEKYNKVINHRAVIENKMLSNFFDEENYADQKTDDSPIKEFLTKEFNNHHKTDLFLSQMLKRIKIKSELDHVFKEDSSSDSDE